MRGGTARREEAAEEKKKKEGEYGPTALKISTSVCVCYWPGILQVRESYWWVTVHLIFREPIRGMILEPHRPEYTEDGDY